MSGNGPVAPPRTRRDPDELVRGVLAGNRADLARAITLVESSAARHRDAARALLERLTPAAGGAVRIGITGAPGVGKSTFIDAFGAMLTAMGHRVAVLAVDPSSQRTGGSILGDKTRMSRLAADERAFIRPSPSSGTLGGVARRTRESMLLCEAAGYGVVIVETVGVGQSETVVSDMSDVFVALMLPGAGDELQGIKRGLLELVDVIAINKADGDFRTAAELAALQYRSVVRLTRAPEDDWVPPVLLCSALRGDGLEAVWRAVCERVAGTRASGAWQQRRRDQSLRWMWALIDEGLREALHADRSVAVLLTSVEAAVREGHLAPTVAADRVLGAFLGRPAEPRLPCATHPDPSPSSP